MFANIMQNIKITYKTQQQKYQYINYSNNYLKMQTRKYITVERSANKETQRPSYQVPMYRETYDTNFHGDFGRYGSNSNLIKNRADKQDPKMKYSQLHKSPSESNFKTRQQYVKNSLARRKGDGMVSNLKSQLQNLKMEVSKLMSKQVDSKLSNSRRFNINSDQEQELDNRSDNRSDMSLRNYGKQISDTISVTSEKIIDQPLRRLQSKLSSSNYDHAHYMELENDLLKTELRNLKNKYNATKQELRQKCQALERKNQYLQISLRRSQQALSQCKKSLQVQLQTIKFQLTRKMQQQYEEDQKRVIQPVRDNFGQNQFVQQKLNKLYEQLAQKSKIISTINIDYNQVKGQLQKKSFQLKKQAEKTNQLSKQLQFSKRENARNKDMLQVELSKKVQLTKTVENLRQKVDQLSKQLLLQNQIVNGSQQLQNKYSRQIQQYKQNQDKLSQQNFQLQNQIRKLRQLNDSHQQQIRHLKNTINDFTIQIEQVTKSLRIQREKSVETQENYRKLLDEAKQNSQRQIQILKQQFQKFKQAPQVIEISRQNIQSPNRNENEEDGLKFRQKQRQISKWKAEYKMLKLKFQQHANLQSNKKQQIQSYYRNYKQYKSKNKILQMRNKVLEQSANDYIQKIQNMQSLYLQERTRNLQKINLLILQNQQLNRKINYSNQQLNQLKANLEAQTERAIQQQSARREIQNKVMNIDIQNNNQLEVIIQKIKKRVADQDQKINKYIKQMKNKDNLIKQLKKQIRNVLENQENQLQKFKNKQIADCIHDIQTKTFASLQQLKSQSKKQIDIQAESNKELIQQNAKMKGQIANMQIQLRDLNQQVKSISHLYNTKITDVQMAKQKHQLELSNFVFKLQQVEAIKNQTIKNLQSQLACKNEQITNYRAEVKKYLSITRLNTQLQNFDQALKNQIEASKKLRQELNKKNQQVYRLRDMHSNIKAELDNLKSQSDIAKLKFITDKKNLQVQFDVQMQNLKGQLSLQQKKTIALENKIKLVIDQNKKKDNFIQNYIMGKKIPTNQKEIVAAFLKQYEICVTGKGISQKLRSQSQQLQKMALYNLNLMKEIAQMKQKLLLYEATSVDNSEMRDHHIIDFDSPKRNNLMQSQSISGKRNFDD